MRGYQYFILATLFFLGIFSCSKDATWPLEKSYPIVQTLPAENVTQLGVELEASILSFGKEQITDFGFVWENDDITYSHSAFEFPVPAEFSLNVTSDLKRNSTYNFRAYVETTDHTVYGNNEAFSALGSSEPELLDFTPKRGYSNDVIKIIGKNFPANIARIRAQLGYDYLIIEKVNFDTITARLPIELHRSGKVKLTLLCGETTLISEDYFTIEGHTVTDFNPKRGIIAEAEVEITGTGFDNSSEVKVIIGSKLVPIIEATATKLKIKLPYSMQAGMQQIKVAVGDQWYYVEEHFEVVSRWKQISPFPGIPRHYPNIINFGNVAYLINGGAPRCCTNNFAEVWKYHYATDHWEYVTNFPGEQRKKGVAFNLNNKIYYGTGTQTYGGMRDFWEFDPTTNVWTEKAAFPGDYINGSLHYSINNKGYLIGGYTGVSSSKEVWEYTPALDEWTYLGRTLIARILDYRDTYFQYNGDGYAIPFNFKETDEVIMYKFNPDATGFFEEITTVPVYIRTDSQPAVSFVLNDILYLGGGAYYVENEPMVNTYNFITGEWNRVEDMQWGYSSGQTSYSFDNKGYTGFKQYYDQGYYYADPSIWMYDPSIQ